MHTLKRGGAFGDQSVRPFEGFGGASINLTRNGWGGGEGLCVFVKGF